MGEREGSKVLVAAVSVVVVGVPPQVVPLHVPHTLDAFPHIVYTLNLSPPISTCGDVTF